MDAFRGQYPGLAVLRRLWCLLRSRGSRLLGKVTAVMSRLLAPLCLLALAAPSFAAEEPMPKVPDGFKCEIVLQAPHIEAPTALCVPPHGDVSFAESPPAMTTPPTKNHDPIRPLNPSHP